MVHGGEVTRLDDSTPHRRGAIAGAALTLVIVVSVVGLALTEHGLALARGLPESLALVGLIGVLGMAVAAWLVRRERPGVAIGLFVAATGLIVPAWAVWDWLPRGVPAILLAAEPFAVAGAAHGGLRWNPRDDDQRFVLTTVYVLVGIGALLHLAGYDPLADPGCALTCARAEPMGDPLISTRFAVTGTALLVALAGAIAGAAMLRRTHRRPGAMTWGTIGAFGLLASPWVVRSLRWTDPVPGPAVVAPIALGAVVLGASVLVSWWAVRQTRLIAMRLVGRLNDPSVAIRDLTEGIRAIDFAMPGEDRWVDRDGNTVGSMPGDAAAMVSAGGQPMVRMRFEPGAKRRPELHELAPVARIALANARFAAVTKARLADVQASRRRIVSASDTERRRIERDLHDGAQQRLVSASMHITLGRSRAVVPGAVRAQALVHEALEQLRDLAHGFFRDIVGTDGLRAALEELIRASEVPATLAADELDVDRDPAMAAYAAVASVLEHGSAARATAARVEAMVRDKRLTIHVQLVGPSGLDRWDAVLVADRIGAVGGRMTLDAEPSRLDLRAELPCES